MRPEFYEKENSLIVYGEDAKEWLDFALGSMSERTAWEFPRVIQEWLFEFVAEVGFRINPTSPRDTLYSWDNAYANGVWGLIDEREWSKKEAKELYEEGELLFFNEASGYYVESL